MIKKILLLLSLSVLLVSCATSYKSTSQSGPSIQYMGTQGDGSITVRVSATGRNFTDALSQAAKYALNRAIFYGIAVPDNAFLSKPLVPEVNAEEKYQYFFQPFFADGGEYQRFVTSEDKRAGSDQVSRNKVSVRAVTTVRILRPELKNYLLENNIIKQ